MPDPVDKVKDNRHRLQLLWLRAHIGETLTSEKLREELDGFKAQMGIYKPSGSSHALWVRETMNGPYPDQEPERNAADGTWSYRYSPEGRGGKPDMNLPTNKGLKRNMDDEVPIAVLRQAPAVGGKAAYEVLGLALVEGYDDDHFHLRGLPMDPQKPPTKEENIPFIAFEDKRVSKTERQVRSARFTQEVRIAYRERCAACDIGFHIGPRMVGLEAAHIIPANKRGTSVDVRNGMLLCANHHALFDAYGWAIDEELRVLIADDKSFRKSAEPNHILRLEGQKLPNLPEREAFWPAEKAVQYRLREFEAFWAR
jgi:hypothetical protein